VMPKETNFSIAAAPTPGVLPARYVPSTARAREELGLRAEVPLREAIRRTQAWFAEEWADRAELAARGAHA
jgi:nucleoside-diphosphate-sugar epimerase